MGNVSIALTFVLIMNVLMFLTQAAMLDINPEGPQFFNCKGSMLEGYDKNKCEGSPALDNSKISSDLPTAEGSVSPTTGNLFTDTFSSIKTWFSRKIDFISQIVTAPYNMLEYAGAPDSFRFAIGTLWYGLTFFLILAFFWGER